jgi:hypothetical protein
VWQQERGYDSQLVVCGRGEAMAGESSGFKEWSHRALGREGTRLAEHVHTAHFEASAYNLNKLDWEDAQSLEAVYRYLPEGTFTNALTSLDVALGQPRATTNGAADERTPADLFRARLGIGDDRWRRPALAARVDALVRQLPSLDVRIGSTAETIEGSFDVRRFRYPNPALMLEADLAGRLHFPQSVTPGRLTGANILADVDGNAWLTDFADAGPAPLLWNYVELESMVRFDWTERVSLQSIYMLEQRLTFDDFFDFSTDDLEPPLRKKLRVIQRIRGKARRAIGLDLTSYHAGLLFEAISRLTGFDAGGTLRRKELLRRGHVLLAAAMISERVMQEPKESAPPEIGLRIDESKEVWVDGVRVKPLPEQSYNLLLYLYERAEQPCAERELIEEALGLRYTENDQTQVARLEKAISRLRKRLGWAGARYVQNVKRGRYCLVRNPEG